MLLKEDQSISDAYHDLYDQSFDESFTRFQFLISKINNIITAKDGLDAIQKICNNMNDLSTEIYENSKILLGIDDQSGHHPVRAAICGASAALSHDMIMTPFDTVKQRMQLGYYSSLWNCFKTIIKKEGVGALYISLPW